MEELLNLLEKKEYQNIDIILDALDPNKKQSVEADPEILGYIHHAKNIDQYAKKEFRKKLFIKIPPRMREEYFKQCGVSSNSSYDDSLKETIEFEDFTKLDIRIGTILEAEKVAKTKKLLKLKVDVGIDVRTIVSGIAESFKPEEIVGQRVSVLVNLAPRTIRGVESQGMILMTDTVDGKLAFVEPERDVKNGENVS